MVDVLGGRRLVTREGAPVEAEAVLQNKVVALYFAAGRCALSRDFTPLLRDVYAALVGEARRPAPFEVVFVSTDGSAREMLDFMRELHGPWLALPFHDPYRQSRVGLSICALLSAAARRAPTRIAVRSSRVLGERAVRTGPPRRLPRGTGPGDLRF
ncbi:Nucleoredoxin-like protein 2 [Tupaia chinensis]|uniref:Nucleoredoxin-like protein 2 n=1 Tax=Tupaia chinensis TaxID=246437 RepID=L9KL09_TUPCH|nr:Nucleoredoxin-like protein 2 [Tupaia chinensis]